MVNPAGTLIKFCANRQIKIIKLSWTFTFLTLTIQQIITFVIINARQIKSTNVNYIMSMSSFPSWSKTTIRNSGAATATSLSSISKG